MAKILPAWKIARAANNKSALEMLRAQAYDLVLTGEETSGRQDVELLRQIRIVRPHVRLIIITSQSTPADVIAAMRGRAFSYFTEPYSLPAFEEMVLLDIRYINNWSVWMDFRIMAKTVPLLLFRRGV